MDAVFISVGSNVGDRESNLHEAFSMAREFMQGLRVSRIYQTAPLYVEDQPPFLNAVMMGGTDLRPFALLERLHHVENALGRDRKNEIRRGPRTLDMDLILYGDLVLSAPALTVPHPGVRERAFVLVPLLDLEPDARDPLSGRMYRELMESVGGQDVAPFGGAWEKAAAGR